MGAYPLADLALARRLERTEARANAAFVDARARLEPDVGATWIDVGGTYAMFDGPSSPITQTFGLGIFDPIGDVELERIETFFREREAPVFHEVSPLIPQELVACLGRRGYRPIEYSNVLFRPTTEAPDAGASRLRVRLVGPEDAALYARIAGAGWGSESPELAAFVEQLSQITATAEHVHCFLAELDEGPIGAAALSLGDDVALLAGASTVPAHRKQGAQLALLAARLRFAAERGADVAMMAALPGSGSQRNAERQGFRIAYTRTKWQLAGAG